MSDWDGILKIAQQNPDIVVSGENLSAAVSNGTTGTVTLDTSDTSAFSAKFEQMWAQLEGPDLEHEFRFHTTRKWRFDYCHLGTRTAIELEGGIWSGGRHTRGKGYEGDCIKYNSALMLGFSVIRITSGMLTPDYVQSVIDFVLETIKSSRDDS